MLASWLNCMLVERQILFNKLYSLLIFCCLLFIFVRYKAAIKADPLCYEVCLNTSVVGYILLTKDFDSSLTSLLKNKIKIPFK